MAKDKQSERESTKRSLLSVGGILVLAVILLLANGIVRGSVPRLTLDFTQEHLYSLSDGTKRILGNLSEPVTLKFYFSRTDTASFPSFRLFGKWVEDLLKRYEQLSGGKLSLEIYDPRPDTEEEEWAQRYGLKPVQGNSGEQFFLGLVGINSAGEERVLPTFQIGRQETLEYDITKLIASLAQAKKPEVAILTGLSIQGNPDARFADPQMAVQSDQPWFFAQQLSQMANVRYLKPDSDAVPEDVRVLFVVHPKNLGEKTLYAIDQFVMKGGRLIVAEDPFCQEDNPPQDPKNPMADLTADRSSDLNSLLKKWGVELEPKKVVGDINLSTRVGMGAGGQPKDFVLFLSLHPGRDGKGDIISRTDIVTSALENILLPWAGALKVDAPENVEISPLLTTTSEAKLYNEKDYKFGGGNPDELLRNYYGDKAQQTLAVRIVGKLKSNFPEGSPADRARSEQSGMSVMSNHLAESKDKAYVVVFSDVDFLTDRYTVTAQNILGYRAVSVLNDNAALIQNLVENLAGNDDLISLRSRGKFSRPFTRVQDLEKKAQENWYQEELVLQAKLKGANERLRQLQSGVGSEYGTAAFSEAMKTEIEKFREERREVQKNLRDLRRNLRVDIEKLGNRLFVLNTFLVPMLLIIFSIVYYERKKSRKS